MLSLGEFPHALSQDGPTKDVASASAGKRRGRGPSDRIGANFSPGAKHLRVESLRFMRQQALEERRRRREFAALVGYRTTKSTPQRRRSSLPSILPEEELSAPPTSSTLPVSSSFSSSYVVVGAGSPAGETLGISAGEGIDDEHEFEEVTRIAQE